MFHRTLMWYRGLPSWSKFFAWIVLAVVAVVSVVVFAIPWLVNSRLKTQVTKLRAEASIADARRKIAVAKERVSGLEKERDAALDRENALAKEDVLISERLNSMDGELKSAQEGVKELTDEKQGDFFNRRYRNSGG